MVVRLLLVQVNPPSQQVCPMPRSRPQMLMAVIAVLAVLAVLAVVVPKVVKATAVHPQQKL